MDHISKKNVEELKKDIYESIESLDIPTKKSRLGELQTESIEEDFWQNQNRAKAIMKEIDGIMDDMELAKNLKEDVDTLHELFMTLKTEHEQHQLEKDYLSILERYNEFQIIEYLSGKYDTNDAILSIHSGQGGTEANDWAEMLMRMYTRYCEKQGWKMNIEHMVSGTETGISSVTLHISGRFIFGMLKHESGVHRLIRLSPFNSQNLRQTSFAGVEVIPVIEDDDEIVIKDDDIDFKAVRSGGPGGQSVNKTSSAVQITHIPTGIAVHSSEHRSQTQNREAAMRILKAKLWKIKEEERQKELKDLKGEYKVAGWGNQIRNYVLHPYKLVKDLRTKVESSNPEDILDGNLVDFIEAQIRIK